MLDRAALAVAGIAQLAGLASLVLPAFSASVTGTLSSGEAYEAQWVLLGWEAAVGWTVALAGALLLDGALGLDRRTPVRTLMSAVSAAVLLVMHPLLASTPLHTWNRWVPVEIQSEYGTEYALLEFATVHDPVRIVAVAAAAAGCLLLVIASIAASRRAVAQTAEASS
jgi:hypothetical protein